MIVVNKDYQSPLQLNLTATNAVKMISKGLAETEAESYYTIKGGDMLLFKLY